VNWFDIVLIVVLVLTTFMGLRRGVISMVLPLAGLIIGIVLAGHYHGAVGGWLPIDNPEHAGWAGYAIIIVAVLIVSVILAGILRRFIKLVLLGWVDRLGGAFLGLVLGGLFCGAALAACVKFGLGLDFIQDSGIARTLLDYFPAVLDLLPGEFGDAVRDFFQ
jgi:membrane protein required for colicin V production